MPRWDLSTQYMDVQTLKSDNVNISVKMTANWYQLVLAFDFQIRCCLPFYVMLALVMLWLTYIILLGLCSGMWTALEQLPSMLAHLLTIEQ